MQLAAVENVMKATVREMGEKGFAGIATGAVLAGLITGALTLAKNQIKSAFGMKEGGLVQQLTASESGIDNAMRMLTPGEFVVKKEMTRKHHHTLEAINKGTYKDTHRELIQQFVELNSKIDTMNKRLSSLETAEHRRKIHIENRGNIKFDRKGLSGTIEFKKHKEPFF